MRRLTFLLATFALLAMALPGSALAGNPRAGTCSGGDIPGGTYGNFTVTGNCTVAAGANVWIKGNLIVARGAVLNDHAAEGFRGAQMHVTGNVKVRRGAVLGLGYNAAEGTVGPDTVGGNIVANHPLTVYLGNVTVHGNFISNGGGDSGRNFPIKDNVIGGNLVIKGWSGWWFGVIRNTVGGNVIVSHNTATDTSVLPGSDSSEIMGSVFGPQTIGGNLICHHNVPAAQINALDGGLANVVGGNAIGECAGL